MVEQKGSSAIQRFKWHFLAGKGKRPNNNWWNATSGNRISLKIARMRMYGFTLKDKKRKPRLQARAVISNK